MEFWILGPLEVSSDGGLLDLGGAKQRALLAMLLLDANSAVSKDRLIDALWEDDPPETAQKALQVYVSGLRKVLGKERLMTRDPGYLLRVEQDELDLARFERLREEGRPADALALWRGTALADFSGSRFAQADIARLEDIRLACLEERIDQDLSAGRHADLTGELEGLVQQYPLRERLRALSMLALYRSGRQADALAAYKDARRVLVDELGLEPGKALRDLHQAMLNQDPALDLPEAERRLEPPDPAVVLPDAEPAPTPAAREARKTVTVLFVAVRIASAESGTIDPEALRRLTSRALDGVRAAVDRHGGVIETVTGGSVTAVFGLPAVHEDDALRAIRAASEIRDRLSSLSVELGTTMQELEFGIALSTGEVVAGGEAGVGAVGEPLTRSSTLGQAAGDGAILIDDPTRRLLRETVVAEPAQGAWRIVEVENGAGAHRRPVSPMVGRERERRRLRDAFDQAVGDGSCQLFTVLGAAGVGKSRLVHEFLVAIEGQALVARGRCLPYGEGITYWPLLEAIKDVVGLEDLDSPDEARAKLEAALAGEPDADDVALRIAQTIGLVEAATGVEAGFAAVRTLFEAAARRQSVVLVLDDIHWGESIFLDLVEHLADWARDVPILLICLARPDLLDVRPGWGGGKLNATSILLEPLSEAESIELIDNLAGGALPERTRQRTVEVSEGNPLFVEEMLALALEDGPPAGELAVPATIQSLLAARLDRLGDDERAVVDVAAVQGKIFYEEAVAALVAPHLSDASAPLDALLHKELIRPDRPSLGGRSYRFRHLLIRDAAYESIPKEVRSDVHERFARWLERVAGEGTAEYGEIVGYHLEQAYRYRAELDFGDGRDELALEAAERLATAGRRAFIRSDAAAGLNLTSRAVDLLPPEDPRRVDLIPNVRIVQGLEGDMSWIDRVLTEAVEAAATAGDRRLAASALVQRGFLRLFTESRVTPKELVATAEEAIAAFEELGDELGLARSWRLIAQAHYLDRRAGASEEASTRALEHARRAGDPFEQQETIQWLSVVLFLGPTHAAPATETCARLLEESSGRPSLEVHVLGALSYLIAIQGRTEEAHDLTERARGLVDELGEGWLFPAFAGLLALWENDPAGVQQDLLEGYRVLKRVGERSHFSTVVSLLARIAYAQGRYDEAFELTEECEEAARPNDVECQIHWRGTRAKVIASRGDIGSAEALAREAVDFAEASDFLSSHGDSLVDLAEVLGLMKRDQEAATVLREAIGLYEQKGNVLSAATAAERLGALEN
jgi:DNA-binding SARP family transcriptional activator/class 3 adenylate cyclase/tetratricopeptide (TPR) repeat protein